MTRNPTGADDRSEIERFGALTPREREVLAEIMAGASNKEAGRKLGISPRTIEVHRARIMDKLGARNAADLVRIVLAQDAARPQGIDRGWGLTTPGRRGIDRGDGVAFRDPAQRTNGCAPPKRCRSRRPAACVLTWLGFPAGLVTGSLLGVAAAALFGRPMHVPAPLSRDDLGADRHLARRGGDAGDAEGPRGVSAQHRRADGLDRCA